MNWKNVFVIGALSLLPVSLIAQANILNAKLPEEIGKKTEAQIAQDADAPLAYGYVDDRDILWSKTTWEIIDLDERVNFPLILSYRYHRYRVGQKVPIPCLDEKHQKWEIDRSICGFLLYRKA